MTISEEIAFALEDIRKTNPEMALERFALRLQRAWAEDHLPVVTLPCDVHLPPNTYIQKGCDIQALWVALEARKKWDDVNTRFPKRGE